MKKVKYKKGDKIIILPNCVRSALPTRFVDTKQTVDKVYDTYVTFLEREDGVSYTWCVRMFAIKPYKKVGEQLLFDFVK